MFQRLQEIWYRLSGYIQNEPVTVVIEILTIWILVFVIATFLRGTRGGRALKGAALVFIVATIFIRIIFRSMIIRMCASGKKQYWHIAGIKTGMVRRSIAFR